MSDLNQWNEVAAQDVSLAQLDALVVALKERREIYEKTKEAASQEYTRVQEIENQILELLKQAKKSKYPVDGIGTVSIVNRFVVRTPKTIPELRALYDYVERKYGKDTADSMFTVNHQTLNSFYNKEKEAVDDPSFQLPGVESPTIEQSLRLTKK